ncbi:transcriptional regulator [Clostridia bacterium]|nr:transcriptional regulator [Clostridia bacterium]
MSNYSDYKNEQFKNPVFKREYDALAAEYELREQIITARQNSNLTQKQLAELIGTRQSNISRLERGEQNPTIDLLQKIAKSLGKELHIEFREAR